jgi:hypothetical protein
MKHDGYKKLVLYSIHFVKRFLQQQHKMAANGLPQRRPKHPATTALLLLSTTSHLLAMLNKIGSRWLLGVIKSMGGLDSIVLAVSTILFTKSVQNSSRIF